MPPLNGQRVVVTRALHQAEELAGPLRDLGATVLLLPTLGIAPPLDIEPLKQAARGFGTYDWILFTSANAVEAFAAQLSPGSLDPNALIATVRIATVGAATRDTAERHGFTVSVTPERFVAESLVEAFREQQIAGLKFLIPSAAVTRDVVASELRKRGAEVTVVEAYRNVVPADTAQKAAILLRPPFPDWITFASSSSVDNLIHLNLVRLTGTDPLHHIKIATIGPVTSQTVRGHGLSVASEARVHTIPGLIAALCH
jgi:uroporphyrinogen III methyltransferase/synthase